jgi:hypothetical protein
MHYMLAIDPGGTTGYCKGSFDGETLLLQPGQERFTAGSLFNFILEDRQRSIQDDNGIYYLIYERFDYRNKARPGLDLTAPKLIGVMDLLVEEEDLLCYPQMPAEAKGYWTDDQLKGFNVYVKGLIHGRDAMRHLLQWWQFKAGFGIHEITPFTKYKVEVKKNA